MINSNLHFRKAKVLDINKLVEIENTCFKMDRMSRRSFQSFVKKTSSDLIVMERDRELLGYGLVLYKKGSSLARLYSIAVLPKFKGQGLGRKLLEALEKSATKREAGYIRLEVASSNNAAHELYKSMGYNQFNIKEDYYQSHDDALCLEKKLLKAPRGKKQNVRFYRQTTEFTCGAASLMMAMNALRPSLKLNQTLEMQIWREATTIFMLKGHGGCGPRGLALAAERRKFKVEAYISTDQYLFLKSVRDDSKKEIVKLVQEDFQRQIKARKIVVKKMKVDFALVSKIFNNGGIPVVLISSYQLTDSKTPHWIVVSGVDENFIYFHDPDLKEEFSIIENQHIPIRKDEFNRMCRYGGQQLQSLVVVYK